MSKTRVNRSPLCDEFGKSTFLTNELRIYISKLYLNTKESFDIIDDFKTMISTLRKIGWLINRRLKPCRMHRLVGNLMDVFEKIIKNYFEECHISTFSCLMCNCPKTFYDGICFHCYNKLSFYGGNIVTSIYNVIYWSINHWYLNIDSIIEYLEEQMNITEEKTEIEEAESYDSDDSIYDIEEPNANDFLKEINGSETFEKLYRMNY